MTEEFVKNAIIRYLSRNEWGTNLQFGTLREPGVDIKVRHNRYSRYFLIECKGQGAGRSSSEVSFVYSLGQIISRMKSNGTTRYYYGLGYSIPAGPTEYFGSQTESALSSYQSTNGIYPSIGYFGPITRAFIKSTGVLGVWW